MTTLDQTIQIKTPKGRPMLHWEGKRPLRYVPALPAQHVEDYSSALPPAESLGYWNDWPAAFPRTGLLFYGDNKEILACLLANGFRNKVKLVYIDPPFDSGADYIRKVQLRGANRSEKLDGEGYSIGEQIQYTDIWENDNYLQFMYERLILLKELLSEDGSMFVHCDWRRNHYFRLLLDEVFGANSFVNEIIWQHQIMGGSHSRRFPKAHESIYWYANGPDCYLRSDDPNVRVPYSDYVQSTMQQEEDGRWYYERRRMSRKATAEEVAAKAHTRTYVDDPDAGTVATDVWGDLLSYQELPNERQGQDLYPTQKTTKLLTRIISAASDPGDIVLDCFAGSGTTQVVAQKLGRRWIGCDINKGAIQLAERRLQVVIQEQKDLAESHLGNESPALPAQLGFSVYRVNDYDLQIQHNEAVALACELLGVQRIRKDSYFDGLQGKRLVKIIPVTHPITPVDLNDIERELKTRPDESRDILVVGLGKDPAVDLWLRDRNRYREQGIAPNRIEVIELRTDPRTGGFFQHEPATARVSFARVGTKVKIVVEDFISPTIIKRLQNQSTPLFQPDIIDWRSMVDSIMIDTNYDGRVFHVAFADIPENKNDYVVGEYELDIPETQVTVALRITDMLGEDVMIAEVA